MIITDDQHVAGKGHVRIRETQQRRTLLFVVIAVVALCGGVRLIDRRLLWRQTRRVVRIEEPRRFRQRGHKLEVADGVSRIIEARGQTRARILGKPYQHQVHALDLGGLVVDHVRGKLEKYGIVGGARLLVQFFHHRHSTVVMTNHQRQEQASESGAFSGRERRHLLGRGHARHLVGHVHAVRRRRIGHRLAALGKPVLHEADLVTLRGLDTPGDIEQLGIVRPRADQRRHLQGLMVMRDHVAHEPDIGRGIARLGDGNGLCGAQYGDRLARRAGLDDRRRGAAGRRGKDDGDECGATGAAGETIAQRTFSPDESMALI